MKFYTKTGDHGTTSIVGGTRVAKTDPRIVACGDIDELNAHVGMLASLAGKPFDDNLQRVQVLLFDVGTSLSSGKDGDLAAADLQLLEAEIDRLQRLSPEVDTFVLPGGCQAAAQAHVCRCVCRRAERGMVALVEAHYRVSPLAMQYINRLSDYFFAVALNLNFIDGVAEKKLYIPCK